MTAVLDSLGSDMHTSHLTSSNFSTVHKSQDSPTLPVSTVTDSSFYSVPQSANCAGTAAYAQLASYSYSHGAGVSGGPYSPKPYDMGFVSSYGAYGAYGPGSSSPTPTEPGNDLVRLRASYVNSDTITVMKFSCMCELAE